MRFSTLLTVDYCAEQVLHPLSKEGGGPVTIRPGLTVEQLTERLPGARPAVADGE